MDCHGLKALAKVVNGSYFAYENGISYGEKRVAIGFLASPHWHWKPLP
jgi:hypothetical protein